MKKQNLVIGLIAILVLFVLVWGVILEVAAYKEEAHNHALAMANTQITYCKAAKLRIQWQRDFDPIWAADQYFHDLQSQSMMDYYGSDSVLLGKFLQQFSKTRLITFTILLTKANYAMAEQDYLRRNISSVLYHGRPPEENGAFEDWYRERVIWNPASDKNPDTIVTHLLDSLTKARDSLANQQ